MSDWKQALKQDYARNTNNAKWSWFRLLRSARSIPGLQYMMWHRLAAGSQSCTIPFVHRICVEVLHRKGYRFGFDIPHDTAIGGVSSYAILVQ